MSESQNFEESILTLLPPEDVNYDPAQFEDLQDGYLFGKFKNYRLKKKLGEGGMGQTWLAEELVENEVSQRVVLKILTRELRGNEDALKEVRRVFDLTKNLNHSSICPLLGRYVDPNFGDFLVMKYADGGTLADWFEKQPGHENGLPFETLLPIFRPLAEALDLAHRNGILHRDVKPQNIMFMGREKTPVLIDFGIAARIRPENVTLHAQSFSRTDTMAHSSSGTPRYMAPEQMEGEPQNGRTDQYALAMVLYEMLTGSLPFSGNIVSIIIQKMRFDPRSESFAQHVNDAFARAFNFDAKERFASCAEFITALTGGSDNSGVAEQRKALEEERRRFEEERRRWEEERRRWEEERRRWEEERNAQQLRETEQKASKPSVDMAELEQALNHSDFKYKIDGDSVTITKYIGFADSIAIPEGVTSIGKDAFDEYCSFTSVTIPDSVTSIGNSLFFGCEKLTEIHVSAGNTHFKSEDGILFTANGKTLIQVPKGKKLTEYTIPDSVTSIGNSAFFGCSRLTSVTLPDNVTSIGDSAFSGCFSLTSVTIPDSVTSIGKGAFSSCSSLTTVTIPNSVTSIGDEAFYGCSRLTSVTIPENVTSIGGSPFVRCDKLTEIRVSAGNTHFKSVDGILFTADGKTLIQFPAGKSLTKYTIPDGVTSIGHSAFRGCKSLTSVTIPDSVTSIGNEAFKGCCSRLTIYGTEGSAAQTYAKSNEILFSTDPSPYCDAAGVCYSHDGKTLLGAPRSLSGEYTIPDSVTSIGNYAFSCCGRLTSVTIPDSVTSIGNYAFDGCDSLTSVTIPNGVTSIGNEAFSWCKSLMSVTIPDSVTSIGNSAFCGCGRLTSVTIPDSVTSIGDRAFYECSSLTSVTIPDSVTSIGNYAFFYCSNLKSVTIPDSVTSIGNSAFKNCERLTIYGEVGSEAERYAKKEGIKFQAE